MQPSEANNQFSHMHQRYSFNADHSLGGCSVGSRPYVLILHRRFALWIAQILDFRFWTAISQMFSLGSLFPSPSPFAWAAMTAHTSSEDCDDYRRNHHNAVIFHTLNRFQNHQLHIQPYNQRSM